MDTVILFVLSLLSVAYMYRQSDYTLDFERLEVVNYNKAYVVNVKLVTFKYNRTRPALKATFTFVTDLGTDLEIVVQAYTFLSNEYRIFPLRLKFRFCDAVANNDFGFREIGKCGNFTGCPIRKETYYINNWAPDSSRFPPHIPNGQYMVELQGLHQSVEIGVLRGYATIKRPFGRRH